LLQLVVRHYTHWTPISKPRNVTLA